MKINFNEITNKYNTPLYLYDFDAISKQYNKLKYAFKNKKTLISYAVKANSNLSVIKYLGEQGSGADCVSIGEVKRALVSGISKDKIIFSGVGKTDCEIKKALELGILMINVESDAELKRIEIVAKEVNVISSISIRVNPNVDAKTHPYISTGLNENKFGVDINIAREMYRYAAKSNYLKPVGIHFHIGSQLTELEPIKESILITAELLKDLNKIDNIKLEYFDVGGGLGIIYNNENLININDYATVIIDSLSGLDVTIICEPGRFLVGNSGIFITKVLYEKINKDKRFVIVDGGMNDLLRPSLYNAYHKIKAPYRTKDISECNVVGPVCESGDFFAKGIYLPKLVSNDLLVIYSTGAYSFSMSSNYNSRPRVAEVALENGKDRLIRTREIFDDLISNEELYLNQE